MVGISNGIETMLTEPTHDHHPEHMMRCVPIGFGLDPVEAEAIAFMPLPTPGTLEGTIFSRLKPVRTGSCKTAKPRGWRCHGERPTRPACHACAAPIWNVPTTSPSRVAWSFSDPAAAADSSTSAAFC